jgi:hypothetical protein
MVAPLAVEGKPERLWIEAPRLRVTQIGEIGRVCVSVAAGGVTGANAASD